MSHWFYTAILAPILLFQGKRVRTTTPRLPEPNGAREANIDNARANILIIGDSSAAGVGASHQSKALSGQILSGINDVSVCWRLEAQTGAKTADGIARVEQLAHRHYDWVVTVFGVNDVTANITRAAWLQQQQRLYELIQEKFEAPQVITCGLPPVGQFPALPQPLRWYLGNRARQFDSLLQTNISRNVNQRYLGLNFSNNVQWMATDGFHPGEPIYAEWGARLAKIITSSDDN